MELKDFQQPVLDSLDRYLDELAAQHENFVKIEKVRQENPGVEIALPDFTESAWIKLRNAGLEGDTSIMLIPRVFADAPFANSSSAVRRLQSHMLRSHPGG